MAERVLSEAEVANAFATLTAQDPLWLALTQLLKGAIIEAVSEVANPKTSECHGSLAHAAGGVEYLSRLRTDLEDLFNNTHDIRV